MKLTSISGLSVAALLLAGCGASDSDASDGGDEKPWAGETLTVLNYNDFGSDRDFAVSTFEEKTGATVEHVYHAGAEEIREILRTGGVGNVDVVQPNTSFLLQLANQDLLEPIDEEQVPNLELVNSEFMKADGLMKDGELYGAPVVWGTTGLVYNTNEFSSAPDSWDVLWEADEGVAFRDSAEDAIMTAALHLGQDPDNPNLDEVEQALNELSPSVETYWGSSDDFNRAFTTGSVTVGNYWDGNTGDLIADGEPIDYVVPDEGVIGWLDAWAIVKDTANPELAHEWVNWMLSTEFQTDWATDPEGKAPGSTNEEVAGALSEEDKERIITARIDPADVHMKGPISPEEQQQYQDLWSGVKVGG